MRDFKAYLFRTANNLAIDEMKKSSKRSAFPLEALEKENPDIFADPERAAMLSEQRAQVAVVILNMNESQRTALALKDVEGWSYRDIGKAMGLSSNAVGALLSRARLKLWREFRMLHIDLDGLSEECRDMLPMMLAVMDREASEEEQRMVREHIYACPQTDTGMASCTQSPGMANNSWEVFPRYGFSDNLILEWQASTERCVLNFGGGMWMWQISLNITHRNGRLSDGRDRGCRRSPW